MRIETLTRPEQHETDSQGKALLHDILARLGWAVTEITEDYGRDFEVEVFHKAQSTGITFSVQLKSSVAPAYSSSGEFVSQELEKPNALYMGLVATWLRVPTMGQTAVHCVLHKYSVVGGTLDGAYRSFQDSYCASCPDRSPRPPDWRYSPEWQEAENKRYKEYIENWRGPTGPRLPPLPLPPDIQRQMRKK